MMNGCSWMIVATSLQLVFGVSQYQSSNLSETKANVEKKQGNNRITSKTGQAPTIFKVNTDLVPDGRQNFNPWGGKKRFDSGKDTYIKNYSGNQDSINQAASSHRQKRRLIHPYGVQNFDCELGDFAVCDLRRLYQTDPRLNNNAYKVSEATAPKLYYNGMKDSVLYGVKKNFNSWGGKRSVDVLYPKDPIKVEWNDPKYKEGKISTEFINQIRNSILFTSKDSYKPHRSDDGFSINLLENNDSDNLVDKSKEALDVDSSNYQAPRIGNLNYVVNKRNINGLEEQGNEQEIKFLNGMIDGKHSKRGSTFSSADDSKVQVKNPIERDGQISAKTWDSDGSQDNVRNQAEWKDKNFSELLHTMRMLNPWKEENETDDSKNYISSSPNRYLRNFEPWAGKRSGLEPSTKKFYIKYPSSDTFDLSDKMAPNKLNRNIRNFEAWGGKRNYYSWGGKRSGKYLNSNPKFNPVASKAFDVVKRNVRSNPDTKLIFFKGNINTWVNKTRKLNSWGGKRKPNENLEI